MPREQFQSAGKKIDFGKEEPGENGTWGMKKENKPRPDTSESGEKDTNNFNKNKRFMVRKSNPSAAFVVID